MTCRHLFRPDPDGDLVPFRTVFADGSADFVRPAAPHAPGQEVTLSFRALAAVPITGAHLRIFPDGEERLLPMHKTERGPFQYWSATAKLVRSPFPYRFRLQTARRLLWLNAAGLSIAMPPDDEDFRLLPGYEAPAWVRESVFYQIFPDRFRRGCPPGPRPSGQGRAVPGPGPTRPHPADCPGAAGAPAPPGPQGPAPAPRAHPDSPTWGPVVEKAWNEPLGRVNLGHEFYGGDLWGIREMLPYLERLGVNALYLNPIFASPSNHRYDVSSYDRVDPYLGGDEALAALATTLGERGMRYILDGVFNHSGVNHTWFQQAATDPGAPSRAFYTFTDWPRQYVSWLGHKNLPKLDYDSAALRETIYRGPDAVARRWLREPFAASGWRLDAPNMLGCGGTDRGNLEVWREFRAAVKAEFPQSYLLGECFFEGSSWLQGDAFDAVMNYKGFALPLIQWLSGHDLHLLPAALEAREAADWMTAMLARVPFEIRNLQYNCLSTHDVIRFISRVQSNEALYRLAAAVQLAYPGVPAIYYGEELAMEGRKDPDNRRPMAWDDVPRRRNLTEWLSRLIGLRRTLPVLRQGAFCFLVADTEALAFARFEGDDLLIVAANRAARPAQVRVPVDLLGLADGERLCSLLAIPAVEQVRDGHLDLLLGPFEAVWLVPLAGAARYTCLRVPAVDEGGTPEGRSPRGPRRATAGGGKTGRKTAGRKGRA